MVTSSVNGVCSKRFLDNGNLAMANQTKLTNVRSYDPLFVEFSVPNPDRKIWAQQFVEVRILAGIARDAVMVPEGAVQFGKDGPYAFVVDKNSKVELRLVKPGVRHDDLLQVIEGVAPGEKVVVLGQLMLYPGAAVMDAAQQAPAEQAPVAAPAPAPAPWWTGCARSRRTTDRGSVGEPARNTASRRS